MDSDSARESAAPTRRPLSFTTATVRKAVNRIIHATSITLLLISAACTSSATPPPTNDSGPVQQPEPPPENYKKNERDWAYISEAFVAFLSDPCRGVVMLRREPQHLTPSTLARILVDAKVEQEENLSWDELRNKVIGGGGPDVGGQKAWVSAFYVLAKHLAVHRGHPPYPSVFVAHSEAILRATITWQDALAAYESMPLFALAVPATRQELEGYRKAGLPDESINAQVALPVRNELGLDACLAVPPVRFDSMYPR